MAHFFRKIFVETLTDLGFVLCLIDTGVWRKPLIKENGDTYYEYILMYVDEGLVISETTKWVIELLVDKPCNYKLKDRGKPTPYLATEVCIY